MAKNAPWEQSNSDHLMHLKRRVLRGDTPDSIWLAELLVHELTELRNVQSRTDAFVPEDFSEQIYALIDVLRIRGIEPAELRRRIELRESIEASTRLEKPPTKA